MSILACGPSDCVVFLYIPTLRVVTTAFVQL